jgi:hypothetical protein
MAEVVNTNVFDANKKFIDLAGLDYSWEIAKAHVDEVDAQLSGKITSLETVLGDASNGIVKEVADLRTEVSALGNIEGGQGIGGGSGSNECDHEALTNDEIQEVFDNDEEESSK